MEQPRVQTELRDVSHALPHVACRVLFKQENQQPSGSFKLRGLGNLIANAVASARQQGKQKVEVFCSSGGNAGLAAAYASRHYGVRCTVVLPKTYKPAVAEKLEDLGAKVVIHGEHWGQADSFLRETAMKHVAADVFPVYCHPFDDPAIWDGHGSMIDEIERQIKPADLPKVKAIVCSVGGGGLYNGIVMGLERSEALRDVPVIAIETRNAASFAEAIKQDAVVELEKVDTIATCLASPYVCEQALVNYRNHKTTSVLVEDKDAVAAMLKYYEDFDEIVEPACGAALFSVYSEMLSAYGHDDIVVVIVCGGWLVQASDLPFYRHYMVET